MKTLTLLIFCFSMLAGPAIAQTDADKILGTYWSQEKDGKVQIYKSGGKYYGKLVFSKNPRLDAQNPDPEKAKRQVVGINVFEDFEYDGEGEWNEGTIYDPRNGKTYSCKIWLEDNGKYMMARGFIGISLIGRTAKFERIN